MLPPSDRCAYRCKKSSTGPLDRKKLIEYINDQALNEPDRPEAVPFIAGTIRGKKWIAPPPPVLGDDDYDDNGVEMDLDEEFETTLNAASEDEIVDLAG